jgi:hypothetical protein
LSLPRQETIPIPVITARLINVPRYFIQLEFLPL